MDKEFVPYQEALELKELGFNEECFATIDQTDYLHIKGTKKIPRGSMMYDTIDCPTFSQAFRFFREKYNLHSYITCNCSVNEILSYDWIIHKVMNSGKTKDENFITDYEQTFEKAELECLKKLIEIVKK